MLIAARVLQAQAGKGASSIKLKDQRIKVDRVSPDDAFFETEEEFEERKAKMARAMAAARVPKGRGVTFKTRTRAEADELRRRNFGE